MFSKARAYHLKIGKMGEKIARQFLNSRFYDIILCDYKLPEGEIDIIARDGETICFVEVKTRRKKSGSRPARGLSEHQKKRIIKASRRYLNEISNPKLPYRFDLIEIILSRWDISELRYWPCHFKSKAG